jgi:hypothetical protein
MSDISLRYSVEESRYFGGNFEVWDSKENNRIVCICSLRKDAGMIAGMLNRNWEEEVKIQQGAGEGW